MYRILLILCLFASLISCRKNESSALADGSQKVAATVEFDNIVGGSNLQLNTGLYTNASNEAYRVTALRYFVSNLVFTKADGSRYVVPQDSSYFLLDEANASSLLARAALPTGDYTALQFVVGVDSLRSASPLAMRGGVLDPGTAAAGMYWSWNSGYIFHLLEGTSAASTAPQQRFQYHIGGFGGYTAATINNLRTVNLDLQARGRLQVRAGRQPNVHLFHDLARVFAGSSATVSFAANPTVMFNPYSVGVANNIAASFSHDHTEN